MVNKQFLQDLDSSLAYILLCRSTRSIDLLSYLQEQGSDRFDADYMIALMSTLSEEGFIEIIDDAILKPTRKGFAFYYTDSYLLRGEALELERQIKQQERELGKIELGIKRNTYLIAIFGAIISLIALIVSIFKNG